MQFSADDIAAILDMMGDDIVIGSTPARGVYSVPGKVQDIYSGGIVTTSPTLLLSDDVAATVVLNSTVITISGDSTQYRAYELMPGGDGFAVLALTKDY